MADRSKIEWTDATWNVITGCDVVSPGCTNCYAMRLAGTRLRRHPSRQGLTVDTKAGPVWNGQVRFNEQWLDQPLRWTRPRMIFVCAHGDLFHESVPDEWIDKVFAIMAMAPQHVFQVLTKRTDRMAAYIEQLSKEPADRLHFATTESGYSDEAGCAVANWINGFSRWWTAPNDGNPLDGSKPRWPLPNVWLGFSAEDQERFDERWRFVEDLAHASWLTWLSAEPLLGPLDAREGLGQGLAWVVAGGESGPGARPAHPDWFRQLRDDCRPSDAGFHFKQWGDWLPVDSGHPGLEGPGFGIFDHCPVNEKFSPTHVRVGKKAAGRLLDGRTWDEMPEPRT